MNRKGFTLIELMIVIAIIAILAAIIIPVVGGRNAHGLEIHKPVLATDGNVAEVIRVLEHDPSQTVTIMVYAETWDYGTVGDSTDEMRAVQEKLRNSGIAQRRITIHLANKGGLEFDGTSVPAADGVYINLD